MNCEYNRSASKLFRNPAFGLRISRALCVCAVAGSLLTAASSPGAHEPPAPSTPRELFNAGTSRLREGKLREAEASLESALASQNERLAPPALYNLGHVRFGQGIEELKKSPSAGPTVAGGRTAAQHGDDAIRLVDEALASNDLQKMVASYLRGRGARKELKAATELVRRALGAHGAALAKWQRSSGDFRSAVELKTSDADARLNAETVDRNIAKLIDTIRELQQCSGALGDKGRELGEKLKQLKGRIPGGEIPGGGAGDEDEEEDFPFGPQPGQQEGPSKDGREMPLTPEQAGWLLDGYKLGSDRRLPMAQGTEGQPKDRSRPTW
jgi:tetratricopeptide (TPR) repeat protein